MSNYFSNAIDNIQRTMSVLLIAALLVPVTPGVAFATEHGEGTGSETATSTEETTEETATTTDESGGGEDGPDGTDGTTSSSTDDTASSTDDSTSTSTDGDTSTTTDDGTGTSTDDGTSTTTDDGSSTGDGSDGSSGDGTTDGETGTTTATTTDETNDGTDGADGTDGGTATTTFEASPEDEGDPVPVVSENNVGEDDATPEEEVTGAIYRTSSSNTSITTGMATAHGELFSDVNSIDVKSEIHETTIGDLDFYTFNATGTNDARVKNDGYIFSLTGENDAFAPNTAQIKTGKAVAALNIANVVNSNVVNSDGFLFLKNQIIEPNSSLDMRDLFFPDEEGTFAGAENCDLLTCVAEDIIYNYSQQNHATVTNNAHVEATTGANYAESNYGVIDTGDAYAGVNVINVVNSNIVDSNYRLMTFNAIGDLDGDLMLPREELFDAFFGRPNGSTRLQQTEGEEITVNANVVNDGDVNNNIESFAETGLNMTTAALDSSIETGRAESESNILNKVNETTYGGDSMYILIRVHGSWNGGVRGLPDGLTWDWTPDGIVIYNEDAEIAPSKILPYDIDTYTANLNHYNRIALNNNIRIDAVTGENETFGDIGDITTGNAFASANVMNIANTNVIATNWTFATINIFGDFEGNITFTEADLAVAGSMTQQDDPLQPGSQMNFNYTVTNNGDIDATGVTLEQTLKKAYVSGSTNVQSKSLGTLAPGQSKTVTMSAFVDPNLATGTHTVSAVARVNGNEGDGDESDNTLTFTRTAVKQEQIATGNTGGDNGGELDTGSSGGSSGGGGGSSGGGGGGGGGSSTKTKSIDREQKEVDPDAAPFLVVKKEADFDEDEIVKAGEEVNYIVTITNKGGYAYDATLFDTLRNPAGSVVNEQSWDLGDILPGEVIEVEYTTIYEKKTPSGTYTNTAHVEAYRHEDGKKDGDDPLKLQEAVHTIQIEGVALGIGNVDAIAYYPAGDGTVNALISWETSKPASGQVFYSPQYLGSSYNPLLPNFGYQHASFRFNTPKTKHYMIIRDLQPGVTYAYKIRSTNGDKLAIGGDYTLTVPPVVTTLSLITPSGPIPLVAGASVSAAAPTTPSPAPAAPAPYTPPPVRQNTVASVAPAPAPEPEPAPVPDPSPAPTPEPTPQENNSGEGFFQKAASSVMGIFGW